MVVSTASKNFGVSRTPGKLSKCTAGDIDILKLNILGEFFEQQHNI